MNKVGWIIFSVVVVLILGGLVAWTRIANPPIDLTGVENNSVIAASEQNGYIADHTSGSESKKILLIEYGDYQCPSCGGASPHVKTLMEEYGKDVTLVFRNFPLTAIHPNARAAAAVAEAAGLQGKFWEMHDRLFEGQKMWEQTPNAQTTFDQYAQEIGLDMAKFKADRESTDVMSVINKDLDDVKKIGGTGTPTFAINGKKVENPGTGEALTKMIEDAIAANEKKQ